MSRQDGSGVSQSVIVGVVVAIALTLPSAPAKAEGLFAPMFRGFRAPPPSAPLRLQSADDFFRSLFDKNKSQRSVRSSGGVYSGFCVRLCDGRYFPIQPHRNVSIAAQCRSFCPSSETRIFSGSGIERAVASNGQRYTDLPNAFVYRKRFVPGCTCSGRTAAGVAHVPMADDPTLRSGDILVTNTGLTVYRGRSPRREATFTPIESAKISNSLRRRLADVKVAPRLPAAPNTTAPSEAETTGAAPADPDHTSSIDSDLHRISVRLP